MPGEYAALGKLARAVRRCRTSRAVAALINGYFGRGGGVELDDALA